MWSLMFIWGLLTRRLSYILSRQGTRFYCGVPKCRNAEIATPMLTDLVLFRLFLEWVSTFWKGNKSLASRHFSCRGRGGLVQSIFSLLLPESCNYHFWVCNFSGVFQVNGLIRQSQALFTSLHFLQPVFLLPSLLITVFLSARNVPKYLVYLWVF